MNTALWVLFISLSIFAAVYTFVAAIGWVHNKFFDTNKTPDQYDNPSDYR